MFGPTLRDIDGRRFVVLDGATITTRHLKAIAKHRCVQVDADGELQSLDDLRPVAHDVVELIVTDWGVTNVDAVSDFRSLRALSLFCGKLSSDVPFDRSPLIRFSGRWQGAFRRLADASRIESVMLERPSQRCWSMVEDLPLSELDFRGAAAPPAHYSVPLTLRHLRVAQCPSFNLRSTLSAREYLTTLHLQSIGTLSGIEHLPLLSNLQELYVEDSGRLDIPPESVSQLQRLILVGSSKGTSAY